MIERMLSLYLTKRAQDHKVRGSNMVPSQHTRAELTTRKQHNTDEVCKRCWYTIALISQTLLHCWKRRHWCIPYTTSKRSYHQHQHYCTETLLVQSALRAILGKRSYQLKLIVYQYTTQRHWCSVQSAPCAILGIQSYHIKLLFRDTHYHVAGKRSYQLTLLVYQ